MSRVLLDTQAFLMAATEPLSNLPKRVRRLLGDLETDCYLSAISISEIAVKTSIGKINFSAEQVSMSVSDLKMTILPFTAKQANLLFSLPLHHRDPFDRMIIAVALAEQLPIVGADRHFPDYNAEGLRVIWS